MDKRRRIADNLPAGARLRAGGAFARLFRPELEARLLNSLLNSAPPRKRRQ